MRKASIAGVVVLALALAACQDTATPVGPEVTPEMAKVRNDWVPFEFTLNADLGSECLDEAVHFVGKRKFLRTVVDDGSGGYHMTFHRNWTGKGTGQTSGDVYNFNFPINHSLHVTGPYPESRTRVWNNYLTRQGGPGGYHIRSVWRVKFNAQGDLIQDEYDYSFVCKAR